VDSRFSRRRRLSPAAATSIRFESDRRLTACLGSVKLLDAFVSNQREYRAGNFGAHRGPNIPREKSWTSVRAPHFDKLRPARSRLPPSGDSVGGRPTGISRFAPPRFFLHALNLARDELDFAARDRISRYMWFTGALPLRFRLG